MMKQPNTEEWLADKKETSINLRAKRKLSKLHHLEDFVTTFAPKRWAGSLLVESEDTYLLSESYSVIRLFAIAGLCSLGPVEELE